MGVTASVCVLLFVPSFSISISVSDFAELTVRFRYCGFRRQQGVFCSRCSFHMYEAWLIDRRETVKLFINN